MAEYMVDIETYGTKPGSIILSIGVVKFHRPNIWSSDKIETFYEEISINNSREYGFLQDQDTVDWWKIQDINPPINGTKTVLQVMEQLTDWMNEQDPNKSKRLIWAWPPKFDITMIEMYYDKLGMSAPWYHSQVNCARTLSKTVNGMGWKIKEVPPVGNHHNALDDATWQAQHVRECFNTLNSLR